MPDIK